MAGTLANLFGPHAANLRRSLDRTTLRHGLLSNNLANVNTVGFKRLDTDFGIELERTNGRLQGHAFANTFSRETEGRQGASDASNIRTDRGSVRVDGSSVDLETEVTALAETEIRYQLLTDMASRYFSGLKNVIREGR